MYKLYFVDAKGDKHFVKQSNDLKQINIYRHEDTKNRGLKENPFDRCWIADGGQWIDFGSWSCYYFIEGVTLEDMCR